MEFIIADEATRKFSGLRIAVVFGHSHLFLPVPSDAGAGADVFLLRLADGEKYLSLSACSLVCSVLFSLHGFLRPNHLHLLQEVFIGTIISTSPP